VTAHARSLALALLFAAICSIVGTASSSVDAHGSASVAGTGQSVRPGSPPARPPGGLRPVAVSGAAGSSGSAPARVGVPIRLRIPALGVDTRLDRLGRRRDGSLDAPPQWNVPGWYAGGPRPGEIGPAVIAGHVDSTAGPAVFFGLARLRVGAAVDVVARGGRVLRFVVAQIRRFRKSRFPTALVYGPEPVPVLRLVTCTGDFDPAARSYLDNLVVSAYPAA
jgi:hypothetical protein